MPCVRNALTSANEALLTYLWVDKWVAKRHPISVSLAAHRAGACHRPARKPVQRDRRGSGVKGGPKGCRAATRSALEAGGAVPQACAARETSPGPPAGEQTGN